MQVAGAHPAGRWAFIVAWSLLVALATAWITGALTVDSDLRLFLPDPVTPEERILLEELEEGPGTRALLVALSGLDAGQLAAASESIATRLREDPLFARVENGILEIDSGVQERVLQYRYLLSPRPGGCACDVESLREQLEARLTELGSPAGMVAQELLLRDPTGELEAILDSWLPASEPQLKDGVWFSRDGERALLLLQTAAAGFDADRQRLALDALRRAVTDADATGNLRWDVTGPGAFTVLLEQSVRRDVTLLGTLAGIGSILFLLFVLRSAMHTVLGVLTLATTTLVALVGIAIMAPSVHGITLAFGFTLLGVAMDYPVHFMLHLERGNPAAQTLRNVWPTLRLSILTTSIAYLALVTTGFTGLAQLGTFTVCGLIGTTLIVRHLLPRMAIPEQSRSPPGWLHAVDQLPRIAWLPAVVLVVAVAILSVSSRSLWSNDLAGLTPVPQELQTLDVQLRQELGAPDLRHVLAIRAPDAQAVLQRDEALRSGLDDLVSAQVIGGYESPSSLLPSIRSQQERQRQLPDEPTLRARLHEALAGLPFREDAFEDFIVDIAASRELDPLTPAVVEDTVLGDRLEAVLLQREEASLALVTLSDVRDAAALERWTREQGDDVMLIDLTATAERLVERYRTQALFALAGALVVIAFLMLAQLTWRVAVAVVMPVLATLAATVALLHLAGVALSLFHIVALLLVGGLSFDYGLFFNRHEPTTEEALRTRHAVMVCWISTLGAFALLMLSSLPVLKAIGSTVSLGVTVGFCLALLARRHLENGRIPYAG